MKHFYGYFPNGKIITSGTCQDHCLELQSCPGGVIAEGAGLFGEHYRGTDGLLYELGTSPGEFFAFNYDTKVWADPRTLTQLKEVKNTEINEARATANSTGFLYQAKFIATDALSRSDIDAINGYIALNQAYPAGWPGAWKAVDNTYLPLTTVDQWKAFYSAMVAAGNANFGKAQYLKDQLAIATTVVQINAIVW